MINAVVQEPKDVLNKVYLRQKPTRAEFEQFKISFKYLLDQVQNDESEEFHKNLISDFLKNTFYSPNHFINTKGRNDLVIHNSKRSDSSVGVIIEAKKPTNKAEMLNIENINCKGFHELILYYLRERISAGNVEIKNLIATNISEWFVFDAATFEKQFACSKKLVRQFIDFEAGRLSGTKTDFFYNEIAKPFVKNLDEPVSFVHFKADDLRKQLSSEKGSDEKKLIRVFKLLNPTHLLKLSFVNDSNTLDKRFYSELLHVIGLEETKKGTRKLIGRKSTARRDPGSLLENTIGQLRDLDKLSRIRNLAQFGDDNDTQLFGVALSLVITWIDRLLFLKLLEAQLRNYHDDSGRHSFLNLKHIRNLDDLNSLYFGVLAKKFHERDKDLQERFGNLPYLNSSLFEPTELEHDCIFVSNLRDELALKIYTGTVLKDENGRKKKGALNTLQYIFEFLEAYDFGGESGELIQEENKTLISATVLGLIFEKLNGYKDGAYFTPGQITMYMCRESIRNTVVHTFNTRKGWNCKTIDEIYGKIDDKDEANKIIESLKICDPAVGSGHFLVSALNEIIAIKSELKILCDKSGKTFRDYEFEVVNDELLITTDDGDLFRYKPNSKESQRVQEAVFHEKQRIIENCLFGVDINNNSVKICRLRLWIELLKHSYYIANSEPPTLETLPNIDINIRCGDSLVSRFSLDSDLRGVLKKRKRSISDYQKAISNYQNASDKERKREFQLLIDDIKRDFTSGISRQAVDRLSEQLRAIENQQSLFEEDAARKEQIQKKKKTLRSRIAKAQADLDETKNGGNYAHAFEWRFEFPMVLNHDGEFEGFDLVIGNPPYGVSIKGQMRQFLVGRLGKVPDYEIYYLFMNLARDLVRDGGAVSLIIPNTIMFNVYADKYREAMLESWRITEIVDCTDFSVFADATVRNAIILLTKSVAGDTIGFKPTDGAKSIDELLARPRKFTSPKILLENNGNWALVFRRPEEVLTLKSKIQSSTTSLQTYFREISQGLIAYDKYTGQDASIIEERAFHSDTKVDESYKEWLWGGTLENIPSHGTSASTLSTAME